uniref:p6 n=1 Tax=Tobacco necrosis virus (strain A) TaxID=12055 RepID=D6MLS5_TNVA|nr:p6 [Tobacco necrosis virus A]
MAYCRCCDTSPGITLFPYFAILILILSILVVGTPNQQYHHSPSTYEYKTQHISIAK